ncbi:MAG TPA: zf-HC2 domain-containing protein, partial [Thermoanaerobaculia bacterium]|nr:zf-HC2 domain-containing protein [Thermoanaerobaculia bacterium]
MVDPREGMPRDCPGDETVAAYLDGTLGSAERRVLEAHLDRCPDCYDQFVETSRFLAQESRDVGVRPFSTGRRSALRRTTVPKVAAGLAAAAALATAGVLAYRSISPHRKSSMALLAEAAPKSRPFAGRVAGLPYAPLRELTRAGAPEGEASLSLLSAAAAIQEKAGATRRAEDFQALGAAQMLLERTAASLGTLEPLAKEHPSAEILSDLSAAYLERSRREDSAEDAARALSAAERALKQHPRLPEALFNRAASLDALGLADAAREAWESYLRADQSSGWADEARRRRDASTPRIPRGANAASDV